jgi:hypothetical protein
VPVTLAKGIVPAAFSLTGRPRQSMHCVVELRRLLVTSVINLLNQFFIANSRSWCCVSNCCRAPRYWLLSLYY